MQYFFCKKPPKPSLKIRTANAIFWIYLGCTYGLKNIFFRNKTFLFLKIESWKFQHLFEIEFRETSQNFNSFSLFRQFYFHFFYRLSDKVEILWDFMKFFFKQILKVSAFCLENKKVLFLKKIFFNPLPISKPKSFVYRLNFLWRFWKPPLPC